MQKLNNKRKNEIMSALYTWPWKAHRKEKQVRINLWRS